MAECRKQGLCYNCDEPYVRGHKCARLFYLEASDYIIEKPAEDDDGAAAAKPVPALAPYDPDAPLISLNTITGIRTEDTMQLYVQLDNEQIIALLESGSTHNFVHGAVARRLGLQFTLSPGADVIVVNSVRVACRGMARDVDIRITDEKFSIDCYSIPLDGFDMVLGVSFLCTLGPIL